MKIIVYTKPQCVQCDWTKKQLEAEPALEYEIIDASPGTNGERQVREMGFEAVPVVVVEYDDRELDRWCGFKVEKIRALKKEVAA